MSSYRHRESAFWEDINGEEIIILSPEEGVYRGVQGVARILWLELQEAKSEAQLVSTILQTYEAVDGKTVDQDVRVFLKSLLSVGLIEEVSPGVQTGSALTA